MSAEERERARDRQRGEWGAVAPAWQRHREKMTGPVSSVTARIIEWAQIGPGDRVLDLASGVGDPAFSIAAAVGPEGYVLGLDLSPEMVTAARAEATRLSLENVEFREIRDELKLGLPRNSFDAATCRMGLMFLPDPAGALRELRAAVRPGGRVCVSTWGTPERNPNFSIPLEALRRHGGLPQDPFETSALFAIPRPQDLAALLVAGGFVKSETAIIKTPIVRARDAGTFWYGVSTLAGPISAMLETLPEDRRQAVKEEVIEAVKSRFPAGPVEMWGEAILGVGTVPGR